MQLCQACRMTYTYFHLCPLTAAQTQQLADGSDSQKPTPLTLNSLTAFFQEAIYFGWHSEKVARELCRRFAGQKVPEVE